MKKEFYNIEVVNVVAAINLLTANEAKAKELPIKIRWALKKNMAILSPVAKNFEDFRNELVQELQGEYFTEEKSHTITVDKEDGTQEEGLQINDEFLDEYNEKVRELNQKLNELLSERNEYEIATVDMDAFVESLADDTALEFDDIEILSFMGE